MLQDRVLQIYMELETLAVPLQQDPQLGLNYLRERMIVCRSMQDRVSNILMEVNRDFGRIRQAVRSQKAVLNLTNEANLQRPVRDRLDEFENEEDNLRYLMEAVKAKSSNLRMTSSDIRLLYGIVEQQIRLGEIQPGRHRPTQQEQPIPVELSEVTTAIDLSPPLPVKPLEEDPPPPLVLLAESDEMEDIENFFRSRF